MRKITLVFAYLFLISFFVSQALAQQTADQAVPLVYGNDCGDLDFQKAFFDTIANTIQGGKIKLRLLTRGGSSRGSANKVNRKGQQIYSYLTKYRGIAEQTVIEKGEKVKGTGRIEFYMDEKLTWLFIIRVKGDKKTKCTFEPFVPESVMTGNNKNHG